MPLTEEDERATDKALQAWRQGDVSLDAGLEFLHLADLSRPHSTASTQVAEAMALQRRLVDKHDKETDEGAHLRALREIRVRAAPSWDDAEIQLSWWFIKDADPADAEADWPTHMDQWLALFDQTGRFRLDPPTAWRT